MLKQRRLQTKTEKIFEITIEIVIIIIMHYIFGKSKIGTNLLRKTRKTSFSEENFYIQNNLNLKVKKKSALKITFLENEILSCYLLGKKIENNLYIFL